MHVSHVVTADGKLEPDYPGSGENHSAKATRDSKAYDSDTEQPVQSEAATSNESQTSGKSSHTLIKHTSLPLTIAIICQFFYSIISLILAFGSILVGSTLSLNGLEANTSWSIDVLGLKSELNSTSQGLVIAVIGLVIAWFGQFKVNMKQNI